MASDEELIKKEYDLLIEEYMNSNHRRKVDKIHKAFLLASQAHAGAKRRSGEPYILHPIAVARIVCSEMGLGSTSICCALLHDVVEDTEYTVEDIKDLFGEKIAQIVDGLTKIAGEVFGNTTSAQAENFRKLILTMNDDIRVILIKIADRLHNMRTLRSMLPAKQLKIAAETMYVYAPLAHRLGLFAIKTELEDLSFQYEHPDDFLHIKQQLADSEDHRVGIFEHFAAPVNIALEKLALNYEIKMRVKSIYSIWKKMQRKGVGFDEIYDLYAVRIIFKSVPNQSDKNICWNIYSAITDIYKSRPDRIRDWISNPKSNGYQALHLTVMGPDGEWVEIQIRSEKMDEIAEKGFAAHWKYKSENVEEDSELDQWLRTIQEILENPNPNAMDFLDTIKLNLYSNDIMVFSPKGDIYKLPQGATALDFAYAIHSEMGDHCIGAKVNHRLVPLSHKLSSGDQVEILSSKTQEPQEDWLNYVTTAKAKSKVDAAIRKRKREKIKEGETKVIRALQLNNTSPSITNLDKITSYLGYASREDLFLAVGMDNVNLEVGIKKALAKDDSNFFMRALRVALGGNNSNAKKIITQPSITTIENSTSIDVKKIYYLDEGDMMPNYIIADCCHPIPGDDVFGLINQDNQVVVHKRSCPVGIKLKSSFGNRILSAKWNPHIRTTFDVNIKIAGIDSLGILNAITETITEDFSANIRGTNLHTKDGIFSGTFTVAVHSSDEVTKICNALKKKQAIQFVSRSN